MKKPTGSSSRSSTSLAIRVTTASVIGASLMGGPAQFLVPIALARGFERTLAARHRRIGIKALQGQTSESNSAS